ncbi:hypothetical protein [Leptolyngbya ohadii]|uniref:hypothetical protein n=1 Tax=Leptolyngbya ohadii TaxID=1962290 RepID=UPI000B5992BF|nr:hypothetical protein [Leptolyngbya ohadii]
MLPIEWRSELCLLEVEITKLRNQSSPEQKSLLDQVVHHLQQADQCLQMVEASQNASPLKTVQKRSLRLLQGGKDDTDSNTPF